MYLYTQGPLFNKLLVSGPWFWISYFHHEWWPLLNLILSFKALIIFLSILLTLRFTVSHHNPPYAKNMTAQIEINKIDGMKSWLVIGKNVFVTKIVSSSIDRWCDKCLFMSTNTRDWFMDTWMNYRTALLYGSLQGLCNMAGVLKAHALTKHDACPNCRAKQQWILLWCVRILPSMTSHVTSSINNLYFINVFLQIFCFMIQLSLSTKDLDTNQTAGHPHSGEFGGNATIFIPFSPFE